MSSLLYSLGRWAFRARGIVVGAWILILALVGGGALLFNQGLDNSISIPGTESQEALDSLSTTGVSPTSTQANSGIRAGCSGSSRRIRTSTVRDLPSWLASENAVM